MKNIYAYTAPTPKEGYVGYISVNQRESGVEVSVRSEGSPAPIGVITLTPEQCEHLATALLAQFNGEPGFGEIEAIAKKDAALRACVEALETCQMVEGVTGWEYLYDIKKVEDAITQANEALK